MSFLVTGGAGYIGSHIVKAFTESGLECVVIDDLSSGFEAFVPEGVPLIEASILETSAVAKAMVEHEVYGVVHLAGYKYAGVSVQRPLHTYEQNVHGTVSLLDAMEQTSVDKIVFSSSAAVYGTPDIDLVTEETATNPESPYGESKLIGEWLIRSQARATTLNHTSLRYFNVVGSAVPYLYDASPHNLFPLVIEALQEGRTPTINGDDYDTPDGTCVRDYIHVGDLADAHVAAADALAVGRELAPAYNLGSGDGMSVAEIMQSIRRVSGVDFEPEVHDRRPGDPDRIVAAGDAAARDLGWSMSYSVEEMMASAWRAWSAASATA